MKALPLALLGLSLLCSPAFAINKCSGPGGKVIYTDEACPEGSKQSGKISEMPPPNPEDVQRARADANQLIERQAKQEAQREEERKARQKEAAEEKERTERMALERRKVEALEAQASAPVPVPIPIIVDQPVYRRPPHHHPRAVPSPPPAAQSRPQAEPPRKDGVRLRLRGD